MRTIWTAISVLAVANLLALGAFVFWLHNSDRLDTSRIREVRALFSETLTARRLREEELAAKAAAEARSAAEKAKEGRPPISAAEALNVKLEHGRLDQERAASLEREIDLLRQTLQRERAQLETERAALTAEKAEFDRARKMVAETEGNAQFRKALATLEGLKPDKAKLTLQQLLDQGGADQVVAYLNAMQERTRTKVIDEFIKSDPKLATDLLERLRTRGLVARVPEKPAE